jgi:uncharacterized RmlC-like cupin family protein
MQFLISSYREWVKGEGIPLHEDFGINLMTAEVAPWDRYGINAAVLNVAGRGDYLDSWLLEVPPATSSIPQHHLFEAVVYVISGRGSTTVTSSRGSRSFEWGPKSVFAIPMNATYQLFNASGQEPARLAMTTSFPIIMNVFHNDNFIFNTDAEFPERLGTDDFQGEGKTASHFSNGADHDFWITNFVPDLSVFDHLTGLEWRGKASKSIQFLLADGVLHAHCSEIPPGSYKKAHRHMGGTHIYPVTGRGYSLLWYEGQTDRIRIDWEHGTCYSPPDNMYHQHFNLSDEPARYFAVKFGNYRYPVTGRMAGQFADAGYSQANKEKKTQIEYEEEDPSIRALYLEELEKAGLKFTPD